MARFYPSYQTLRLADQILDSIAARIPGYQGRIGARWYWRLTGGVLVTFEMDYSVTEQRWDILRAVAVTPTVGLFNAADFPFAAYGTLADSPPFIHDLDGEAEWSNRLYFQMGHLIEDAILWMEMLSAAIIDPQVRPPSSFPELNGLERELVAYAIDELNGYFTLSKLYAAFSEHISRRVLSRLGQYWEDIGLLTESPRRVTVALRALADMETQSVD
ncbi:MAG: hypothetical protein ACK2UQ_06165 [Anaerolineae bacterium]